MHEKSGLKGVTSHGLELGDARFGASAVQNGEGLATSNRRHYPQRIMRTMGTQTRTAIALPRWLTALLGGLPGLALVTTLLVMGLTGRHHLFNLSTRDTVLVAGIGSVLIGLVLSLTIVCMILIRSMR